MDSNQNRLRHYEKASKVTNDIMLRAKAMQAVKELMAMREEVIKAYVAKHGFQPEDTIQVEMVAEDGTHRWFLREMTDEEKMKFKKPNAGN